MKAFAASRNRGLPESLEWRWDRFWLKKRSVAEDPINFQHSPFLASAVAGLPVGAVLDAGMGAGRNAVYLAKIGWDVTGVDISHVAIANALELAKNTAVKIRAVHSPLDSFHFGISRWDLIVFMYVPLPSPEVVQHIFQSLRLGGHFVFEHYHKDCIDTEHVHGIGVEELLETFKDFKISICTRLDIKPDWDEQELPLVRLIAKKI